MQTLTQCTIILYTKKTIFAKLSANHTPRKEKAEARRLTEWLQHNLTYKTQPVTTSRWLSL